MDDVTHWIPMMELTTIKKCHNDCTVVAGHTVVKFVTGMLNNVPCDAIVKKQKDEGNKRRTCSHEKKPLLSIQIK